MCVGLLLVEVHTWRRSPVTSSLERIVEGCAPRRALLFDDTPIADDPVRCVGVFLFSERELEFVSTVRDAIDNVLDEVGLKADDAAYVSSKRRTTVVEAAASAKAAQTSKPS